MRLIDADALMKDQYIKDDFGNVYGRRNYVTFDEIENAPTVEQTIEKWIPIETRPMDEDERKEWSEKLGYELEDDEAVIYMSLPDDGQNVLICLQNGHVMIDTFEQDDDYGCYFVEYGEMDGVVAWMPLPTPWRREE